MISLYRNRFINDFLQFQDPIYKYFYSKPSFINSPTYIVCIFSHLSKTGRQHFTLIDEKYKNLVIFFQKSRKVKLLCLKALKIVILLSLCQHTVYYSSTDIFYFQFFITILAIISTSIRSSLYFISLFSSTNIRNKSNQVTVLIS